MAQDGEVGFPGPDLVLEPVRDDPRDLGDVVEVVDGPGGEQLPQRDLAQFRVKAARIEIGFAFDHFLERRESGLAQGLEFGQQFIERAAASALDMREAVEGRKRPCAAVCQNPPRPRNPVVDLALNEMSQHAEGAERPLPLIRVQETGRQILE